MRKKKNAPTPEQKLTHEKIDLARFVAAMRQLKKYPEFRLLQDFWLAKRTTLIEKVKKNKQATDCAALEGFDEAIMVPEVYAQKQTADDVLKRQQDELQAYLNGENK